MKTPWWFLHRTPLAYALVPVSWIYYGISRMVYAVRSWRAQSSRRPVICVGNIFAGGVGKTPIVCEIAQFLDAPVVMRGYKKSARTGNAGDEALMLSDAGLQVHTGHRRANIALLNRQKTSVPIVMDDGFQNPTIRKDISILVFDARLGYGNGFLLPAGPLREGRRAIRRADAVIVIRSDRMQPGFELPTDTPVFYATNRTIVPDMGGRPIAAFAGIGYPKKFFDAVNASYGRGFPDHYPYTDADIERLRVWASRHGAKLLTTQKDWMRLPPAARHDIPYAPLETVIDPAFFDWLQERLNAHTKTHS